MRLYKVSLNFSRHFSTYYVAAEGYDAAAKLVGEREGDNGSAIEPSITSIEPVAWFGPGDNGGDEENLIISNAALALLTGE